MPKLVSGRGGSIPHEITISSIRTLPCPSSKNCASLQNRETDYLTGYTERVVKCKFSYNSSKMGATLTVFSSIRSSPNASAQRNVYVVRCVIGLDVRPPVGESGPLQESVLEP